MKIIIILLLVYVLSIFFTYLHIHTAHSKNGRWYTIEPDFFDLFITIMPIFNTMSTIILWLNFPPKTVNRKSFYIKFFNIK